MISQKAEVPLDVVPGLGKASTKTGDCYQSPVRCDQRVEADSVGLSSLSGLGRFDVDASTFAVEIDRTVHQCEERPVPSGTHILAGVPLGATLTDQNIARDDSLAAELLDPPSLGIRVATVAGRALTFLMCHRSVFLLLRCLMPVLRRSHRFAGRDCNKWPRRVPIDESAWQAMPGLGRFVGSRRRPGYKPRP